MAVLDFTCNGLQIINQSGVRASAELFSGIANDMMFLARDFAAPARRG